MVANIFQRGETIICWRNVKNVDTGAYEDPTTSMKITINNFQNGIEVDNQAMTPNGVGKYHYDFNSTLINPKGNYTVFYTATDGARITIFKDSFKLE